MHVCVCVCALVHLCVCVGGGGGVYANFSKWDAVVVRTSNCYNNKTSELMLIFFASF